MPVCVVCRTRKRPGLEPGLRLSSRACVNPVLEPEADFALDVAHSASLIAAQTYPLGEYPCRFKSVDMGVAVEDDFFDLLLAQQT